MGMVVELGRHHRDRPGPTCPNAFDCGMQQRLTLLLRLAVGETAPLGPAAERAKKEAVKLLRAADTRSALAADPEVLEKVRGLVQATGLAA